MFEIKKYKTEIVILTPYGKEFTHLSEKDCDYWEAWFKSIISGKIDYGAITIRLNDIENVVYSVKSIQKSIITIKNLQ